MKKQRKEIFHHIIDYWNCVVTRKEIRMPGLGPDMSALNLLSQANLSSVLNKVY